MTRCSFSVSLRLAVLGLSLVSAAGCSPKECETSANCEDGTVCTESGICVEVACNSSVEIRPPPAINSATTMAMVSRVSSSSSVYWRWVRFCTASTPVTRPSRRIGTPAREW